MTSFVSGDSVFQDGTPVYSSPSVVENSKGGFNIDLREDQGVNLTLKGDGENIVYTSSKNDFIISGDGDDIFNAGGGDDYIEGGDGDDIIRGGDDDDIIRGGKGFDRMIGGEGEDLFLVEGSDLLDAAGNVIPDLIYDFDPSEGDSLVFKDLEVESLTASVSYDKETGFVELIDENPDQPTIIAKLPNGLDIQITAQVEEKLDEEGNPIIEADFDLF